jgi:anti-sigma factor RsiW
MKTCLSRERLEAAVLGEAPEALLPEIEAHAESCARCRHELSWLRTEIALFSQRTAREEVNRLWEGVSKEQQAARRPRRFTRALLAVAASVLFAVTLGGQLTQRPHSHTSDDGLPMSLETMSVGMPDLRMASAEMASMPCYTPGFGPACE